MQLGVVQQWRKILFELWQKVQEGPKATDCEWEGSSCILEKHLQRDVEFPSLKTCQIQLDKDTT